MWQVRRCLNILQRASKEEIEDLFSTSSEVQKMNGMVQTLQIMLGAIEARKAVVEERDAGRLAEAAAPAGQSNLVNGVLSGADSICSSYFDLRG